MKHDPSRLESDAGAWIPILPPDHDAKHRRQGEANRTLARAVRQFEELHGAIVGALDELVVRQQGPRMWNDLKRLDRSSTDLAGSIARLAQAFAKFFGRHRIERRLQPYEGYGVQAGKRIFELARDGVSIKQLAIQIDGARQELGAWAGEGNAEGRRQRDSEVGILFYFNDLEQWFVAERWQGISPWWPLAEGRSAQEMPLPMEHAGPEDGALWIAMLWEKRLPERWRWQPWTVGGVHPTVLAQVDSRRASLASRGLSDAQQDRALQVLDALGRCKTEGSSHLSAKEVDGLGVPSKTVRAAWAKKPPHGWRDHRRPQSRLRFPVNLLEQYVINRWTPAVGRKSPSGRRSSRVSG
ncbi:MAG: hypothetical protein IT458_20825 [Planctomycetes bacterium]|nr:hypothetical protein [Planctomycetota bacterium]